MDTLTNEMIYDMKYKGYSIITIKNYTYCVRLFSKYFMKDPLRISKDQIINFFSYLRTKNKSESKKMNANLNKYVKAVYNSTKAT